MQHRQYRQQDSPISDAIDLLQVVLEHEEEEAAL